VKLYYARGLISNAALQETDEFSKVGCSQASDWIPPRPSSEAIGVAPWVVSRCDVVKSSESLLVEPGVQESKRSFALGEEDIIQIGDDGSKGRRRSRRATDGLTQSTDKDLESGSLGRDVRDSSAGFVVESVIGGSKGGEKGRAGRCLVIRDRKVVAKAARGEIDGLTPIRKT